MKINKFQILILITGFSFSGIVYHISKNYVQKIGQKQFELQVEEIRQIIVERLHKDKGLIRSTKAMFESTRYTTKEEWEKYVRVLEIELHHPGLAELGFVSYVSGNKKDHFVKKARSSIEPSYQIWPMGERADYFPMLFVESVTKNTTALGFDIGSDPVLRAAALQAHNTGRSAMSGRIDYGPENEKVPAFMICLPVYKIVKNHEVLKGWVIGTFLMEDLMSEIKRGLDASIDVEIYDGTIPNRNTMMYDGDGLGHALNPADHSLFKQRIVIPFAGHNWTLYATTGPVFSEITNQTGSILILIAGILLTVLLSVLYHVQSATKRRAENIAQEMTSELADALAINEAILNGTNCAIISVDFTGTILTFNAAASRMLGYSAEEMLGKKALRSIHDPHEIEVRAQELSKELGFEVQPGFEVFVAKVKMGVAEERQWTYVRKDGSCFPVLLSVTSIMGADGEILRFMGVASDMTEQQKINQIKNEFISTVSHELRTPLTSIKGSLGLISGAFSDVFPEAAKPLLKVALANSERLVRLVDDILDFEKLELGKANFQIEPVDVSLLIREVAADHMTYAQDYKVSIEIEDLLPKNSNKVMGNRDRLNQVLANLISNAVKFSPQNGRVLVRASLNAQKVCIQVIDNGSGIPEDFKDRVFQKFAQAHVSHSGKTHGTGLGLSISKTLVEKMGGTIGFNSSEHGTEFYFNLNLAEDLNEIH
ncbi:MAG: CHASE domain-containing protein [Myxococcaceae bacterium]